MKLAPVLAKYLAANKQLDLPGLGSFYMENPPYTDDDGRKSNPASNITFEQKKITKIADDLVEFVSKETGKMKVLALSDISSQLDDTLQFLNTGKPYSISGIGTLTQTQTGAYDFQPERVSIEKRKEIHATDKNTMPQTFIDGIEKKRGINKPAIIILTLAVLAIAATIWFYLNMTKQKTNETVMDDQANTEKTTQTPTLPAAITNDTLKHDTIAVQNNSLSVDYYKYILENAIQPRATKRFTQLKTLKWPVELETKDSVTFSIVVKLPKAGSDTTKIKDSLSALSGKKVIISQ